MTDVAPTWLAEAAPLAVMCQHLDPLLAERPQLEEAIRASSLELEVPSDSPNSLLNTYIRDLEADRGAMKETVNHQKAVFQQNFDYEVAKQLEAARLGELELWTLDARFARSFNRMEELRKNEEVDENDYWDDVTAGTIGLEPGYQELVIRFVEPSNTIWDANIWPSTFRIAA